jgi:hypothetical protein
MTKITNISAGPRGIYTETGLVVLAPGETRDDLKVSKAELDGAKEGDWFHVGEPPKPKAETEADQKALQAALKTAQDELAVAQGERDAEKARADQAEAALAKANADLEAATKPADAPATDAGAKAKA